MPEHTVLTPDGRTLELLSLGVEVQSLGELVVALASTSSPTPEAVALLARALHRVVEDLELFSCGMAA